MNVRIDPRIIRHLIALFVLAAVIKTTMLVWLYTLPLNGVDSVKVEPEKLYEKYRFSRAFALKSNRKKANTPHSVKPQKGPLNELNINATLKAIYATKYDPFIAVEVAKKVTLLGIGASLQGYKLVAIHPEYATFAKGARRYAMRFKELKGSKDSFRAAQPEELPDVNAAVFVKRKEIHYYAKHLNEIWKSIKIKELIINKKLQGFRVTWIKKGSIFDKLGLKKGDIITGVNNKKFKSISQVFKIYNNIQKMDSLKLTILRDNEERELEYEIL